MLVVGLLQSRLHRVKQWTVPTILRFKRHLGDVDGLLLDQILLVDVAQAPRLDEFVGELSVEEETAFLDAPRDPRLEGRLRTQVVDVYLLQVVRIFLILLCASATVTVLCVGAVLLKLETVRTDGAPRDASQSGDGSVGQHPLRTALPGVGHVSEVCDQRLLLSPVLVALSHCIC